MPPLAPVNLRSESCQPQPPRWRRSEKRDPVRSRESGPTSTAVRTTRTSLDAKLINTRAQSSAVVHLAVSFTCPLTTAYSQLIIKAALEFAAKLPLRGEDDSYQGILWRGSSSSNTIPPEIPATF
jgi:hypothetical protein